MRTLTLLAILAVSVLIAAHQASGVTGVGRFRETQVSHRVIGEGAGALEVWRTRVYTYRGDVVGTGAFSCTYVDNNTSYRQCTATYLLPLGKIILVGNIVARGSFELAVAAGTRYYEGSHGTALFRLYAKRPPQSFLTFYLLD